MKALQFADVSLCMTDYFIYCWFLMSLNDHRNFSIAVHRCFKSALTVVKIIHKFTSERSIASSCWQFMAHQLYFN
jgi:hypothetical protein